MNFIDKNEIKRITGKSESTIKKFIQSVKKGDIKPVDERVNIKDLTRQRLTRNKQVQILVNELFVKIHFDIDGLENQSKPVDERVNEPVKDVQINDLIVNKLSDEVEYLRGLLAEKERKNEELTNQLMNTNNRLFEVTETNQKLLQNQQILQQTQQTKSLEESPQKKRKWWQRNK
jgi:hypothetical protein